MPRMPKPVLTQNLQGHGTEEEPYHIVVTKVAPTAPYNTERVGVRVFDENGVHWFINAIRTDAERIVRNLREAMKLQLISLSQHGYPAVTMIKDDPLEVSSCSVGVSPDNKSYFLRLANSSNEQQDAVLSPEALQVLYDSISEIMEESERMSSPKKN